MMMQLNPTLPVFSIKHNLNGFAFAIIDYLQEHYVLFLVGLNNGEIWCLSNRDVRLQGNDALHRISASLKAKNVKEEEVKESKKLKDKEESKVGREELMKAEEKRLFVELRNNSLKGEIGLLKKRNEELRKIIEGFEERNNITPVKEITTKTEEVYEKLKNEINYELSKDKIKEIYNTTPAKVEKGTEPPGEIEVKKVRKEKQSYWFK